MCGKWSVDPPSFNCSLAKTLVVQCVTVFVCAGGERDRDVCQQNREEWGSYGALGLGPPTRLYLVF